MAETALVSYILVNWRTEDLLPRALESISYQTHHVREIIVVDNGGGLHPGLLAGYGEVTLLSNPRNLGFAVANNQGLAVAQGEFIVLLNCDAYLDPEFTRLALEAFRANPRLGSIVPKILRDDGSSVIDSAGHMMYRDRTPAQRGQGERDQGQYSAGGFVFGGTAAAIAYRREMLECIAYQQQDNITAGGAVRPGDYPPLPPVFDEAFFAYYEDVDLDWRANLCGWRAYFEPDCLAYHRGHGSGGRSSYAIRLRAEKNRYLMLVKNDTLGGQLGALWPLTLYEGWHGLKLLLAPWLWPALFMLLWHLPDAWAYRLRAGRRRSAPPREVQALFVPRGPQPPPMPAPPGPSDVPLLERPGERRAASAGEWPLVSVIVLNYNGLELTRACLASLLKQSYDSLELIVVDNGSNVDEGELLALSLPRLKTLRLERNHGFAGGVDWGLTLATGEYIALINNDCMLDPDCIKRLVYAQKRTSAGAVSGRLVDIATPELLPAALAALDLEQEQAQGEAIVWDMPPELGAALAESWRNHGLSHSGHIVSGAYGAREECFYASGGLCLLSRWAVQAWLPRLLPHHYFAYHEDVYLGLRLRTAGGWVAKEPRAAAVHLHGSTARRLGRPRLRFLQERNRLLNLCAFYPGWALWRLWPRLEGENALAGLALLARPGDWLGWLGAQVWFALHPLAVLRWRRECRAGVSVPDAQWLRELSGQVRGEGGLLNRLALRWCRLMRVPCREDGGKSIEPE